MTEEKFKLYLCSNGSYYLYEDGSLVITEKGNYIDFDNVNQFDKESLEDIVALLNEQHETITTLNNQLNNFKLHSKDLEEENKLLKEALREELQDNGNAYYIKIFDKLFNLNYDEWDNNERYRKSMDWEERLQLKELSDVYD